MKTIFIPILSMALLLGLVSAWLYAQQPPPSPLIGAPHAMPTALAKNKPTTLTVTIPIPDPSLIPSSVNLLRLGATGTQPTILGVMHDDDKNGDVVAGDGIYTRQVLFNETATEHIQLQVSVALRGLLKRSTTPPITIDVTADATAPLPPDPGPAGMTTLAGVDSDGDGVRDDVQRFIATTYPSSSKTRAALTSAAQALQSMLLNAGNKPLTIANALALSYANDCLDSLRV